jgi:hypothetical protein
VKITGERSELIALFLFFMLSRFYVIVVIVVVVQLMEADHIHDV